MTIRFGILSGAAALAAATALATGADARDIIAHDTVGEDWFDLELTWDVGAPTYFGKWMIFEAGDGSLMVCGAGAHSGGRGMANRKILRDLGIHIGEDLLLSDMRFFAPVARRSALVGSEADCVATGRTLSEFSSRDLSLRKIGPTRRY